MRLAVEVLGKNDGPQPIWKDVGPAPRPAPTRSRRPTMSPLCVSDEDKYNILDRIVRQA